MVVFPIARSAGKNERNRRRQIYKPIPDAKRLCSNIVLFAPPTPEQVGAVSSLFAAKMNARGLGVVWEGFSRTFLPRRVLLEMWCHCGSPTKRTIAANRSIRRL